MIKKVRAGRRYHRTTFWRSSSSQATTIPALTPTRCPPEVIGHSQGWSGCALP
jgi:hypothetical protein